VFIEGVFQQQDAYSIATAAGTTTLTFSAAPANGNSILIYSVAAAVSGSNLNIDSMTGDGSDVTLTLTIAPVNENNTQVFIDGVYQNKSTYSISGTTLTFSTAPPNGSAVEVMTMTQTDINVPVDGTITSAKLSGDLVTPGDLDVTGTLTADGTAVVRSGNTLTLNRTDNAIGGAMSYVAGTGFIFNDANGDGTSFNVGAANRVRIDSSGNVGIGTSSPAFVLDVNHASDNGLARFTSGDADAYITLSDVNSSSAYNRIGVITHDMYFNTNNAERMRIDSSGNLLVGKTSSNLGTDGVELRDGTSYITNTSASPLVINREGTDGQLIGFYNDAVAAGAINVSGGTVSYTAFMGSHYSETADSNILFGTVMEATGDLVENEYTAQQRLTKTQVSTTSESAAVYGVWIGAMEGGGETIAAVGASWCRINSSATIAVGDLLTSNGDGTAKVQSDDIIRSKTIGKVTSTTIKETHADGSYVVPVVLYCG
jgi:hypothetical protein